jgi:type IV pilus assembly protein PilZ
MGHGILYLTIKDLTALYAAYMPFLKNGGLFIPTDKQYRLGDEVFLLLQLMDENEKIPVVGRIAWVTPRGGQHSRPVGVGVQFGAEDGGKTRARIETYLAGRLQAEAPTNTI